MSSPVHQVIRPTAGATVRTRGRVSAASAGALLLSAVGQQAGRPDTGVLPVPVPVSPHVRPEAWSLPSVSPAGRTDRDPLSVPPPA